MNAKDKALALAAALEGTTPDQVRQRQFITDLCNNLRTTLTDLVPKMPPEWDGHELRELLYDHALRLRSARMYDRRGRRYRNYDAHCLTYNLY